MVAKQQFVPISHAISDLKSNLLWDSWYWIVKGKTRIKEVNLSLDLQFFGKKYSHVKFSSNLKIIWSGRRRSNAGIKKKYLNWKIQLNKTSGDSLLLTLIWKKWIHFLFFAKTYLFILFTEFLKVKCDVN